MSKLVLKQLSIYDGKDIYDMLQRIGPNEGEFHNDVNGMTFDKYKEWLRIQSCWANGEMLPIGYVRQWTYWLFDEKSPVGYGKLREQVTEKSREFGGNIGFAIDPLCRGKGYGKFLFSELLRIGREKKLSELYSTVEKFNYPSKAIHENTGGELVKETNTRWYFSFDCRETGGI